MPTDQALTAALLTLIIFQIIMLASLMAGAPPHPPEATPLSGIGPFVSVAVATAITAPVLDTARETSGRVTASRACALALLSFGPQKELDPQFTLIWATAVCARAAVPVIAVGIVALHDAEQPARVGVLQRGLVVEEDVDSAVLAAFLLDLAET